MSHYEWWDVRAQIVERKEKQSWLTLIRNSSSAATNKVNPELQQTLYYTHIMNSEQKVNNWFADVTRARKHCQLKRMVLNKSCFSSCKFLFMYFFFFFFFATRRMQFSSITTSAPDSNTHFFCLTSRLFVTLSHALLKFLRNHTFHIRTYNSQPFRTRQSDTRAQTAKRVC